jgi:uncharacterized protein DUF3592
VFVTGVLMILGGLAMAGSGVVIPVEAARPGLIIGGLAMGLGGVLLAYLDAPSRRKELALGMARAKATILEASGTPGAVAGYQMVELSLEVRPKDGAPFQVKRKFSAGRIGRIEQGRTLDVVYDPANPERVELA